MGNILHANAKTTPLIRKEIQESKESILALAEKYNLNPKTISKWRHAGRVSDGRSGPIRPKSALSEAEQEIICTFRRTTQLALDDVFIALKDCIPALTRSNLHRCLRRHGLNVLPKDDNDHGQEKKKKFKDYPPGFVHIDITEVRIENGDKHYIFVMIDRATKYVYVELHPRMTIQISVSFLKNAIEDCPFKITKILTDNGPQFTYELLAEHLRPARPHPFDVVCAAHGIDHRLTKFRHPWTNGQVEVTNRVIKKHTTKTYHYAHVDELKKHLMAFLLYYNFRRPLRALKYKTPYDKIKEWFTKEPSLFRVNPSHKIMGLNI